MTDKRAQERVVIVNDLGLHVRAASLLAKKANRFVANIWITRESDHSHSNNSALSAEASAKSVLNVLSLAACKGDVLLITAEGTDAQEAVLELATLIAAGFHLHESSE